MRCLLVTCKVYFAAHTLVTYGHRVNILGNSAHRFNLVPARVCSVDGSQLVPWTSGPAPEDFRAGFERLWS